jgi:hypothetical protein
MKLFVALNFIAGFLHYLFLVLASRQLPAGEFSDLSAWLAYLSFAFLGAAVLQYLSCFVPLSRKHAKLFVAAGLIFAAAVGLLPAAFRFDHAMIGALGGLMACAFGIFLGQAQARLLFMALSAGNLAVGFFKLLFALILPFAEAESYFWAVPLSYAPAIVLLSVVLFRHAHEPPKAEGAGLKSAILSTVVLGAASALFPQFELMLMRATQMPEAFNAFARLSLFYKAIFFVFLIFSQWLLPHQLRDPKRAGKALSDPRLYAGAVLLAAAGALLGPYVATLVLGWGAAPSRARILLSCWNMGLLTWIFLLLQDLSARRRNKAALLLLSAVFLIAPLQLAGAFAIESYYAAAILWNSILIWRTVTSSGAANPASSSLSSGA